MINKTDLRIGNSVMLGFEILTVKAIEHNPVNDKYYIKVEEDYRQILCDFLNPIPITEEALCKMGFEYSESKEWLTLRLRNCNIDSDRSIDFSVVYAGVYEYKFAFAKSIHQLQNLYYALTQTELTYEP